MPHQILARTRQVERKQDILLGQVAIYLEVSGKPDGDSLHKIPIPQAPLYLLHLSINYRP